MTPYRVNLIQGSANYWKYTDIEIIVYGQGKFKYTVFLKRIICFCNENKTVRWSIWTILYGPWRLKLHGRFLEPSEGCALTWLNIVFKVLYYTPFIMLFQIAWASVQVSHLSLIPCLTSKDSARVQLNSIRYAFTVLSNLTIFLG